MVKHTPESPSESRSELSLSRRNFLRLGAYGLQAVALPVATVGTWDAVASIARDHNRVDVKELADEYADTQYPHTATLYLPGLKNTWNESHKNLKALQPTLRSIGRMASVGYSNRGFNQHEVGDTIEQYLEENEIEKVYLYGGSFSGLVATAITPRLVKSGYEVPVIFCDSSPTGPHDVLDQSMFKSAAWVAENKVSVPELARFSVELGERVQNKNERSVAQIINQSFEQIGPVACSTDLAMSQINYINNFKLRNYADKLGDTQMVYLGNKNDAVVNHQLAVESWHRDLPRNMRTTVYDTGGAYHASPYFGATEYNTQVRAVIENLELIPRSPRTNTPYTMIE